MIVQQLPALSSVLFSVALRDNSSSEAHMLVQGLAASTYDAVIFDIEKNGIPQIPNTLAAGTENVTVSSGPQFKTGGKLLTVKYINIHHATRCIHPCKFCPAAD